MTSIKFTASGCSAELGNFAPGDIARNIPAELAQHLVQDACCAEYLQPPASAAPNVALPAAVPPPAAFESPAVSPAPKRKKKTPTTHKEA